MNIPYDAILMAYSEQCKHIRHLHSVLWTMEAIFTGLLNGLFAVLFMILSEKDFSNIIIIFSVLIGIFIYTISLVGIIIIRKQQTYFAENRFLLAVIECETFLYELGEKCQMIPRDCKEYRRYKGENLKSFDDLKKRFINDLMHSKGIIFYFKVFFSLYGTLDVFILFFIWRRQYVCVQTALIEAIAVALISLGFLYTFFYESKRSQLEKLEEIVKKAYSKVVNLLYDDQEANTHKRKGAFPREKMPSYC